MNPNIGLSPSALKGVVGLLNTTLSDEFVIYTKTLNYHWNVEGMDFSEYHLFFQKQYEELAQILDEVAERTRALGGKASGSLGTFLQQTRLTETSKTPKLAKEMIKNLLTDHETLIRHLRKDIETCASQHHDTGTNDFLTGLMEQHEKMAWMLRAHLA